MGGRASEDAVVGRLAEIVGGDHVSVTHADRQLRSYDDSTNPPVLPDIVVWPGSAEEVSAIARLANSERIPITGRGAASSGGGHTIPVRRGIVLDLERMSRILALHAEDFQVVVEPGVLRLDLEEHLGRHGLFFAPDPGANASIGGMIANNAAGIRALRYGATRDNVLGLQVVLADGEIIETGSRSIKQSSGYDLTRLMIGSEGTLGLVTRATLRLRPIPEHVSTAIVGFASVSEAAAAVYQIVGSALDPAALELLHEDHVRWMNEDEGSHYEEVPTLMMEFTGSSEVSVEERMEAAVGLCRDNGAVRVTGGIGREARNAMWRLRHGVRHRYRRRIPGGEWIAMDVSVPVSRFPELVEYATACAGEHGLRGSVLGHAGDGNLHMGIGYLPDDDAGRERAHRVTRLLIEKALELEGTISGEHGIGLDKRPYMEAEHGAGALAAMEAIKRALDPNGILNPGKVLP